MSFTVPARRLTRSATAAVRTVTALGLVTGGVLMSAHSANAGPESTAAVTPTATIVAIDAQSTLSSYQFRYAGASGVATHTAMPTMIHLDTDGDGHGDITTYCIELTTPTTVDTDGYVMQAWDGYTPNTSPAMTAQWKQDQGKIAWLVTHSSPTVAPQTVLDKAGLRGLSDADAARIARDATQAAIWHFANGADLIADGTDVTTSSPVYRLYTWLLNKAEDVPENGPITGPVFSAAMTSGDSGTTVGPVRLTTDTPTELSGTLPAGVTLQVSTGTTRQDLTGDVHDVTVAADSTLAVQVPAGTADARVSLTATSTVARAALGSVWYRKDHQSLITASAQTKTVNASTALAWTAPSAPVVPAPVAPTPVSPVPVAPTPVSPTPVAPTPRVPATDQPSMPKPTPTHSPEKSKTRGRSSVSTAMVTRTFQVDRYAPRTTATARTVAHLDDDARLTYREDRALWGASRWQFVAVRVPAHATKAQVIRAINASTSSAVGDVTTTGKLASATKGRAYTVAWELGRGATPAHAWGPKNRTAQTFFARR